MTTKSSDRAQKYWIVGGSEGIGLELVKALLANQQLLLVSSRNAESHSQLLKLCKTYPDNLKLLNLDVCQPSAISGKVKQAWQLLDGIDYWFYNAGSYRKMSLSEWDIKDFELMNQTNYLGTVYLMNQLLPYFQNQGYGKWVWNISLAADFGLPYGGAYSAPKAALLNLAESLQPELAQQNIELKIINHGFVKTRLTAKNDFYMLGLMAPESAAKKIINSLNKNPFESRFPFNLALILGLLKRLPKSWSLWLTKKALKPIGDK